MKKMGELSDRIDLQPFFSLVIVEGFVWSRNDVDLAKMRCPSVPPPPGLKVHLRVRFKTLKRGQLNPWTKS